MTSGSFILLFSLGLALIVPLPISAQEASDTSTPSPPITQPEQKTLPPDIPMEAYGAAHPLCTEWTDACRSCARDATDHIACATPGIACQPEEILCKTSRDK